MFGYCSQIPGLTLTILPRLSGRETSAKLLSHLNAHAPLLSRVLAGCISLAAFSSTTSSSSPFPWSALQKERSALLDLGVQAANAACALADDNAAFAAALAGRPAPTLPSARGKKGKAHREEEVVDDEARDGAGLEALHEALSALKAIREAGQAQSSVQGQVAMLGVLACGERTQWSRTVIALTDLKIFFFSTNFIPRFSKARCGTSSRRSQPPGSTAFTC